MSTTGAKFYVHADRFEFRPRDPRGFPREGGVARVTEAPRRREGREVIGQPAHAPALLVDSNEQGSFERGGEGGNL